MSTKSALAQQLGVVAGFDDPQVQLEQYRTPPDVAAHLVHTADLHGDVEDNLVIDLGCGTGMLALGAALRGPTAVVGLDVDDGPLRTAIENEGRVASSASVSWVRGDATEPPLCPEGPTTVLMNPPFGAQSGNEHADREFLATASDLADVSYSIHNEGSQEFVEAFAADNGGEVTHAFRAAFEIPHMYEFHDAESQVVDAEVFRIVWSSR